MTASLAESFDGRFDIEDDPEEGVSLICTECSAKLRIPSPEEMLVENTDSVGHANQILELVRRILAHLDKCKPQEGAA